jgi:uncharacterized protein (DUF1778 family)
MREMNTMTRLSFKTTHQAKSVMQAVAELRHQNVADIVHGYFYQLAKDDLAVINEIDGGDEELLDIFNEAIMQ